MGEAPTSEILQFAYALKLHGGGRIEEWDGWSTRRALASIGAIRTGKLWPTSVLVSKELPTDQIVREACRAYVAPSSCSAWAMASRRATN